MAGLKQRVNNSFVKARKKERITCISQLFEEAWFYRGRVMQG